LSGNQQGVFMSVKSIDMIWISVKDFDAAIKFYTEVVGLKLMEKNEEWGWAELQGENGARFGIGKTCEHTQSGTETNAIVCFNVEDLDQSMAEMKGKGAVCVGDVCEVPGHVKMQLFRDLDGHLFHVVQKLHACC